MKKSVSLFIFTIVASLSMAAQGLSGASLIGVLTQGGANAVNKYVSAKGFSLLEESYDDSYFAVWGSNVAYYTASGSIAINSNKPQYVLIVNFTDDGSTPLRLKYRPTSLTNMRNILAYFKKLGYKRIGTDYAGADVYSKNGGRYEFHYHESGRTILIFPTDD